MENFDSHEVVLVPFPFTDRSTTKRRPALVLSSDAFYKDTGQIICAMITTAKRSSWKSDVTLKGWAEAGLPAPSKVRMKVFTLDGRIVLKKLGKLSGADARTVVHSCQAILT